MKSISEKIKIIDDIETKKEVRKGWDNAFKQAIANGDTPKNDMFEGMKNAFDDSEW